MSKQEKRVSLKSIAQFPDKLNTFAIFLIVILYGALLYLITSLSFPPVDYRVGLKNLDYAPGKEAHNEEINPFVLVRGTVVNKSEDEGKVDLGVQYRVYAYIDAVENKRPLGVKYFYSLTDKEGKTWFLYESKTGTDTPVTSTPYPYQRIVSHNVGSNIEIGKDAITDLYMKVKYNIGEEKNKVYKVTEKVLGIRKSELNAAVFKTEGVLDDILEVTFSFKKTDNEKYSTNFTLNFLKDIENPFHLNLQSWIVSKSGKIYPLLGLYNYRSPKKFNPTETTVYKYVQPEYIYLKLEFTDHENAIRRLYYKTAISDLLGE